MIRSCDGWSCWTYVNEKMFYHNKSQMQASKGDFGCDWVSQMVEQRSSSHLYLDFLSFTERAD